jgi:hypothetical protein
MRSTCSRKSSASLAFSEPSPSRCHQPGIRSATPSGYSPLKMALRENGVAVGRMEQ